MKNDIKNKTKTKKRTQWTDTVLILVWRGSSVHSNRVPSSSEFK